MPSPIPADVLVGRVLRPRGFAGELQVEPQSDFEGRFDPGEVVFLLGVPYRIEYAHWQSSASLVLKLEGIDSSQAAERLRSQSLFVPSDSVPSLPLGQYYYFQLLDIQVYTSEGEHLGQISEIMQTGSNDVYVVTNGPREILIPAMDDVILEVDVEARRMLVDLPEGLR